MDVYFPVTMATVAAGRGINSGGSGFASACL